MPVHAPGKSPWLRVPSSHRLALSVVPVHPSFRPSATVLISPKIKASLPPSPGQLFTLLTLRALAHRNSRRVAVLAIWGGVCRHVPPRSSRALAPGNSGSSWGHIHKCRLHVVKVHGALARISSNRHRAIATGSRQRVCPHRQPPYPYVISNLSSKTANLGH